MPSHRTIKYNIIIIIPRLQYAQSRTGHYIENRAQSLLFIFIHFSFFIIIIIIFCIMRARTRTDSGVNKEK